MSTTDAPTVLLTGTTSGLGRAVAQDLAQRGAHLLLHGRDPDRLETTRAEIARTTGNDQLDVVVADLAELRQVEKLAAEVQARCDRLDVLINNAGIGTGPAGAERAESHDGIELRFAVNYLAGYHLTRLLLGLLAESGPARVVNVASAGQHPIDFDDPLLTTGFTGSRAYAQSKLAQIMFTFQLAEQLDTEHRVTTNALHPATYMNTVMVREAGVSPVSNVDEGVHSIRRLAVDPELADTSGRYFHGTRESRALDQAYEEQARERLRELSDTLVERARSYHS